MRCWMEFILVMTVIEEFVYTQPTLMTIMTDSDFGPDHEVLSYLETEVYHLSQTMVKQERRMEDIQENLASIMQLMQMIFEKMNNTCDYQNEYSQLPRHPLLHSPKLEGQRRSKVSSEKSATMITRLDISDRWVYGVAKLDAKIYVLCYNPNSILVAEDHSPFATTEIAATQIKSPYDLAASQSLNCLYIIDIGNECIWMLNATDHTITLWLTGMSDTHALSVTKDGELLVIRADAPCLELYNADGVLSERIPLPYDVVDPQYAVQTSTGTFIVSHKTNDVDETWILSELDEEGLVRRTSVENVDDVQQNEARLRDPVHLAIDSRDRLFVANRWASGVLLFDSELRWNQTILNENDDGIQLPMRVCYDEEKAQLIVVHGAGGGEKVDVYSFI